MHEQLKEQGIGYAQWRPPHDPLNTVILKLTNACNLACTYCYDHEDMVHRLYDHAHGALLAAKEQGRNRVACATSPVAWIDQSPPG